MRTPRQFTIAFLKERCAEYRTVFLGDGTASAEEMDPYWPGGDENPHAGLDGWVLTYGRCLWLLGRAIGKERAIADASRLGTNDAQKLQALHSEPESVELLGRTPEGAPHRVIVYPKSGLALEHIGAATLILAHLRDQLEVLEAHGGPDDLDAIVEAREHVGYFERLCCWIATHPGPGLPYPRGVKRPEIPETIEQFSPLDYFLVAQACQRVNVARLQALEASESSDKRPDWPAFYVGAAAQLNTSVQLLWEAEPLAAIAARASEHARIQEEAKERAKQTRGASAVEGL